MIDHICETLDLEREVFDESRSGRLPALARRLLVRVWVREYGGSQAELARHLDRASSIVSRWHSRAVSEARSHGELYQKVVEKLPSIEGRVRFDSNEEILNERKETRTTVNVEVVRED